MIFTRLTATATLIALLAAPAMAAGPQAPLPFARISGHQVLTDAKGMTLYTFDKDIGGVPSCSGLCAFAWPASKVQKGAQPVGKFTIVARRGGAMWAYKGHPLYRFFQDRRPGDMKGDGVEGVWHAAVK